jgi:small subunit ribosomal protein S20
MKKIIQKRWFKVGAVILGVVILIGLSCGYYFGLLLPQKEKTVQLEQISAKIKTYGKLIDIKRSEIKNSENQIDIIENQIELAKLEREELQLKGNDAEKIEEKQKYIEKKEKEASVKVKEAIKAIDKAVQKKIIKKNAGARKKSRLMKKLNQMTK